MGTIHSARSSEDHDVEQSGVCRLYAGRREMLLGVLESDRSNVSQDFVFEVIIGWRRKTERFNFGIGYNFGSFLVLKLYSKVRRIGEFFEKFQD